MAADIDTATAHLPLPPELILSILNRFSDLYSLYSICLVFPNVQNIYKANQYRVLAQIISNRLDELPWCFLTKEHKSKWVTNQTRTYQQCHSFEEMMDVADEEEWFWDDDAEHCVE